MPSFAKARNECLTKKVPNKTSFAFVVFDTFIAMKLYPSAQLKQWDAFTVKRHFQSSAELMELAAENCVMELEDSEFFLEAFLFCGIGNNGGDGLCIARLLSETERIVTVFVVGSEADATRDFKLNMERLVESDVRVVFLNPASPLDVAQYQFNDQDIIIDALLGTGISRPVDGYMAEVIAQMNALPCRRISIDIPSGLMCDELEPQQTPIVRAHRTLALQVPKRSMLMPEHTQYVGELVVLNIALDPAFFQEQPCDWNWLTPQFAKQYLRERDKNTHKHAQGHLAVLAGSKGMMGAALLAAKSAMRAGVGMVTAHVPACGEFIIQTQLPEALCLADDNATNLSSFDPPAGAHALVVGPGMGQAPETALMLRKLLKECTLPLVLDADALNLIAAKDLLDQVPAGSILTPHIGEFERLFGKKANTAERIDALLHAAVGRSLTIVLKGAHTIIASPHGELYFNSTGNPGMATAGSGDVLSGIIGALLAQGHDATVAAALGVYIHGMAGDITAEEISPVGFLAGEMADRVPKALELLL